MIKTSDWTKGLPSNSTISTALTTQEWLTVGTVLEQPSQSPDLNPIKQIMTEWQKIPKSRRTEFVASYPKKNMRLESLPKVLQLTELRTWILMSMWLLQFSVWSTLWMHYSVKACTNFCENWPQCGTIIYKFIFSLITPQLHRLFSESFRSPKLFDHM